MVVALLMVLAGGCRLFVDLDGITGEAPTGADAGSDGNAGSEGGPGQGDDSGDSKAPMVDSGDAGKPPVDLTGCVLLMHLDEASWPTANSVIDSSGSGNNGTAWNQNGVALGTVSAGAGRFGNGAKLDGTSWIRVPDSASLHAVKNLTLSAWIYPTGGLDNLPTSSPGILCKRDGFGVNVDWNMFLWNNDNAYVDIGNDNRNPGMTAFAYNKWYHVAMVFDGTQPMENRTKLYVNGVLDGTFANNEDTLPMTGSHLLVGNLADGGTVFVGTIDEVAVWTRSLNADEIKTIYTANQPL